MSELRNIRASLDGKESLVPPCKKTEAPPCGQRKTNAGAQKVELVRYTTRHRATLRLTVDDNSLKVGHLKRGDVISILERRGHLARCERGWFRLFDERGRSTTGAIDDAPVVSSGTKESVEPSSSLEETLSGFQNMPKFKATRQESANRSAIQRVLEEQPEEPPGWKVRLSRSFDRWYYYCPETNQTSWKREDCFVPETILKDQLNEETVRAQTLAAELELLQRKEQEIANCFESEVGALRERVAELTSCNEQERMVVTVAEKIASFKPILDEVKIFKVRTRCKQLCSWLRVHEGS